MYKQDSENNNAIYFGNFRFNGEKLKLARELHCMTLTDLSKKIGVTHQMISNYENGNKTPSEERLKKIVDVFDFPRSFFFSKTFTEGERNSPNFFRKGAAVPKKYQIQVEGYTKIYSGLRKYLESKVNLPQFSMPTFSLVQEEFRQIDFSEIELLADSMRKSCGLGNGPIGNMTLLCEKLGIGVFFADLDNAKIDAHTVIVDDKPYILLNKAKKSSVRLRFNIAHELGHILMHSLYDENSTSSTSNHKRIEVEANYFAGCFLIPEDGLALDMAASNLNYLISLKQHWKVSLQAIIYRAEQINLFSNSHTLHLRQQISRNKWRLNEPLDDEIPIEKPKIISLSIEYLRKNNPHFIEDLFCDISLPSNMIDDICSDITKQRTDPKPNYNNVVRLKPHT
ncbi:XRE family transcriptional regulator [Lentibacillus sp. Marseille-P4043]|uniref:XRE family transcriptional regulator n=1 Tax=Lentibacillus sp. Marseille-P4043 TaxID=2040293 RepID=UPI000D0B25F6|nr:XRE family transcriptional regulator [Lentibacillus sp. Marseille-P4043]